MLFFPFISPYLNIAVIKTKWPWLKVPLKETLSIIDVSFTRKHLEKKTKKKQHRSSEHHWEDMWRAFQMVIGGQKAHWCISGGWESRPSSLPTWGSSWFLDWWLLPWQTSLALKGKSIFKGKKKSIRLSCVLLTYNILSCEYRALKNFKHFLVFFNYFQAQRLFCSKVLQHCVSNIPQRCNPLPAAHTFMEFLLINLINIDQYRHQQTHLFYIVNVGVRKYQTTLENDEKLFFSCLFLLYVLPYSEKVFRLKPVLDEHVTIIKNLAQSIEVYTLTHLSVLPSHLKLTFIPFAKSQPFQHKTPNQNKHIPYLRLSKFFKTVTLAPSAAWFLEPWEWETGLHRHRCGHPRACPPSGHDVHHPGPECHGIRVGVNTNTILYYMFRPWDFYLHKIVSQDPYWRPAGCHWWPGWQQAHPPSSQLHKVQHMGSGIMEQPLLLSIHTSAGSYVESLVSDPVLDCLHLHFQHKPHQQGGDWKHLWGSPHDRPQARQKVQLCQARHLHGLWHPRQRVDLPCFLSVVCQRGEEEQWPCDKFLTVDHAVPHLSPQALSTFGSDAQMTSLLTQMDVYVLPLFNIDGYEYTHTNVSYSIDLVNQLPPLSPFVCWFVASMCDVLTLSTLGNYRTGCGGKLAPGSTDPAALELIPTGTLTLAGAVSSYAFVYHEIGSSMI